MRLTNYTIARSNISRRPLRNFCLIFAEIIFTAFLLAGSVLSMSLSNGAESISNRLGADIMLVPAGYDPRVDNILLSGKPSALYLPDNALELVNSLDLNSEIEKVSPQVFMATLRASCCAYPVQIMGIDYKSDFIVKSWLDKTLKHELNDGEIILGFHNTGEIGDEITFFGENLKIAGRLERTGMGLDSSVFVNRDTIIKLANAADKLKSQKLAENNNLISVIMIKLKAGQDTTEISRKINRELNPSGIYALTSKKFVGNISSSLVIISRSMKYFFLALWFIVIIIAILLNYLRNTVILYKNSSVIIFSGAITGMILGCVIIFTGSPFIAEILHLPFLLPSIGKIIFIGIASIIITIITALAIDDIN